MAASPSSVRRTEDIGSRTARANRLIADIVPMLDGLGPQGLQEVRAYLEAKIVEERRALEKGTTKVCNRGAGRGLQGA